MESIDKNHWMVKSLSKSSQRREARIFVYFVGPSEGPIKIGKAKNVSTRLRELQTGHPYKLEILGVLIGRHELEGGLHHRFAKYRLQGEWFERSDEIMNFIEQNTLSSEAAFYKNLSAEAELGEFRKALVEKTKVFETRVLEKLIGEHKTAIMDDRSVAISDYLALCRKVVIIVERIEKSLSDKGLSWYGSRQLSGEARTLVRTMIGCDWRVAEQLLRSDEPNDEIRFHIEKATERWLDRAFWKSRLIGRDERRSGRWEMVENHG